MVDIELGGTFALVVEAAVGVGPRVVGGDAALHWGACRASSSRASTRRLFLAGRGLVPWVWTATIIFGCPRRRGRLRRVSCCSAADGR